MKAILEFELPADAENLRESVHAGELRSVVRNLCEDMRQAAKYQDDQAAQKWRSLLVFALEERDLLWVLE